MHTTTVTLPNLDTVELPSDLVDQVIGIIGTGDPEDAAGPALELLDDAMIEAVGAHDIDDLLFGICTLVDERA
jgi:hypothetical protein